MRSFFFCTEHQSSKENRVAIPVMTTDRKRSISPHSVDTGSIDNSNGLKKLFSFFIKNENAGKQNHYGLNGNIEALQKINPNDGILDYKDDQIVISDKRRRISIQQSNQMKAYIPRRSIVEFNNPHGSINKYGDYLNKIQEENDEERINIERRATLVDFPEEIDDNNSRYDSPIPDIGQVKRQSLALIHKLEDDYTGSESDEPTVEHVFPQPYTDEEGNIIRPEFINPAPRERYKLLQYKKELETKQKLESKMKYMLNPHETLSIVLPGNKVETATQTQDIHYLRNKLHFNKFIKRRKSDGQPQSKIPKTTASVFSGEFLYDVTDYEKKKESNSKLSGYLGSVSKPKFSDTTDGQRKEFTSDAQISLDSDYVSKTEKISDIIKVKDDTLEKKSLTSVEPSTGFQFSIKKDDVNDILNKRKKGEELISKASLKRRFSEEQPLVASNPSKKEDRPIAIPKFNSSKEASEPEASQQPPSSTPAFSFGKKETPPVDTGKPAFSFGSSKTQEPKLAFNFGSEKKDEPKPAFSFDVKKTETKPAFSFGKESSTTPSFGLGDKPQVSSLNTSSEIPKEKKEDKPAFSFGALAGSSTLFSSGNKEAPKFTFGENKKEEAPKFTFGTKSDEKKDGVLSSVEGVEKKSQTPQFSFGKPASSEEPPKLFGSSENKFSFGGDKQEAPKFSFGATEKKESTDKKDDAPKFTFGSAGKKDDAPKFSFGSTEKAGEAPKLSFGSSATPADKPTFGSTENKSSTPAFSFGSAPQKDEKSATPFSFGGSAGSADKKEATPGATPGFTLGAKPSFNFGTAEKPTVSSASVPSSSPFNFGVTQKPAFGAPSAPAAPAFGSNPGVNVPSASAPAGNATPFQFGAVENPTFQGFNKDATPGSTTSTISNNAPINSGFLFANGITPVKPVVPVANQFGGFNKESTPGQFNFSRSNTNTPDFANSALQPSMVFGSNTNNMGANMGASVGANMGSVGMTGSASAPVNRPNRKIAQMRRRRGA